MNVFALQYALGTGADGIWGPKSDAALRATFVNLSAPAVTADEIVAMAKRLGCTPAQLRAVAAVESSGSGFDIKGRPKILFERHLFHRLTNGKWTPRTFSMLQGGGYELSSWDKLSAACGCDPDAAFSSASWGKFQVLGMHWSKLGYASAFELAKSCTISEGAHYELFARYIEHFDLADELARVSANPDDCRAFAKGYNGAAYERFSYHTRIAKEME